jgi:heme-degrading monooxygenase HmoA
MIVEYIRYAMPAGKEATLLEAYRKASPALDASPHCLGYEVAQCVDAPTQVTVRIKWDSSEGHLQGFRKSGEFKAFLAAIGAYVPQIIEMRHYTVIQQSSARGG